MVRTASDSGANRGLPNAGMRRRPRSLSHKVTFFAPGLKHYDTPEFSQECSCRVQALSVTGKSCGLMCDHCRGRILAGMTPVTTPEEFFRKAEELAEEGCGVLLASGGSDSHGVVPLAPFIDVFARIRDELSLSVIVHTGITDAVLAGALAGAGVSSALIDIPGSDETIRQICHLDDITTAAYDSSLANLVASGLRVVPHVVIGLHNGEIVGEYEALRLISRHKVDTLVLVALRPLEGTPMAGVNPPDPEMLGDLFRYARGLFPQAEIMLGCERPGGRHKEETDMLALEAGLDGIAFPADGIVKRAYELGLKPSFSEMCCGAPLLDGGCRNPGKAGAAAAVVRRPVDGPADSGRSR